MNVEEKDPAQAQPIIRLSQCMIVKNEEKNIARALGWGKNVAFEQIVVDTGSTDKTVEIAEGMGAKVFQFKWIDDFAAAKNHAIEQATGNWIAFLDADEYFSPIDAKKLIVFLKRIETNPEHRERYLALDSSIVNLDDDGKPASVFSQQRVFRNLPSVRYSGRIHEQLSISAESVVRVDEIRIVHTGYTETAKKESNKAKRNTEMLREELARKPDDLLIKLYLADALKLDEDNYAEAEEIFTEIINSPGAENLGGLKQRAYVHMINKYISAPDRERLSGIEEMCLKALDDCPGDLDLEYFYASVLNYKGDFRAALEMLSGCEAKLTDAAGTNGSVYIAADPTLLFGQMLIAAQGLGDIDSVIKYAGLILSADKFRSGVFGPYIATLLQRCASGDEVVGVLARTYDLDDRKDLLHIARAAKDCGAVDFSRRIIGMAERLISRF